MHVHNAAAMFGSKGSHPEGFVEWVFSSQQEGSQDKEECGDQRQCHERPSQPNKEDRAQTRQEGGLAEGCASIQQADAREHECGTN